MSNIKAKKEEQAELIGKMKNILEEINSGNLSADQVRSKHEEYDSIEQEANGVQLAIETAQRAEKLSGFGVRSDVDPHRPNKFGITPQDHDFAFRASVMDSVGYKAPAAWDACRSKIDYSGDISLRSSSDQYAFRANTVGTGSAGGYLAHTELANEIVKAQKWYGGIRDVARVVNTSHGNDILWPTFDNTSGTAVIHVENEEVANVDKTVGQMTVKAQAHATASFPVSLELIRDASFNIYELIGSALGEDIGRFQNNKFTVGTGTSGDAAYQGIVTGSTAGKTCASATDFTWLEIMDLIASIDYSHQKSPNFGLMMHFSTYSKLLQLEDDNHRPLFLSAITDAGKMTLAGVRIYINNDMDSALTAGKKLVLAGDFSKFLVRDVDSTQVITLKERFATQLAVGFVAHATAGCKVLNSSAIKHMKLAAS